VNDPRAHVVTAGWIVRAGVVSAAVLVIGALALATLNGTFSRDPTTFLSVALVFTYAAVGGLLAARLPRNPIGWLFLLAGLGVLLGGAATEYATYTLGTNPGALPFGIAAAWIGSWSFIGVVLLPTLILLFPTGAVPSPPWRWILRLNVLSAVVLLLSAMFRPGVMEVSPGITPRNPLGIELLQRLFDVLTLVFGLALLVVAIASVVALVQRFRRTSGEERQQLRWFAAAAAVAGGCLVLVIVTSIGLTQGQTSLINDIALYLFLVSFGIGLPVACAIAILKYRLYDLDVVVKKTVLYVTVAVLLLLVFLAVAVTAGGLIGRSRTAAVTAAAAIGLLFWPALRFARRIADRIVYGGRATPYEVLSNFGERMSETYSTDDVLPRTAQLLAAATGATRATVWLRVGRQIRPAALWPDVDVANGPLALQDGELPHLPSDWAEEVRDRGELLGALAVDMPASDPIGPTRQRLMRDLAAHAGLVLRNVRLIEELRESRRRIVGAQDEERRRLERNIHDGAQQQLVAIAVQLKLLEDQIERDPHAARSLAIRLQNTTTSALEDLRDLARGIYPPLLADEGLRAALEAQARKAALPVSVEIERIGRYGQETEAAVYFCTLEALQNVAKYAAASSASVRLLQDDGQLTFEISDDGRGFDVTTARSGTGLQGMADRLEAIGGALEIQSAPGHGTTIVGHVPAG
jgi:signal transduction histidine kinase